MQVTSVTPGLCIQNLAVGDSVSYSLACDSYLWINKSVYESEFECIQDSLYFYAEGRLKPDGGLLPRSQVVHPMDLVRVGIAPEWKSNPRVPYVPADFNPTVPQSVVKDFNEIVGYIEQRVLMQDPKPISAGNQLATAQAFCETHDYPRQTVRAYASGIMSMDDVSLPLMRSEQATHLFRHLLSVAAANLMQNPALKNHNLIAVSLNYAIYYNWAVEEIAAPDRTVLHRSSQILAEMLDLTVPVDFDRIQKAAGESMVLTACLYMMISSLSPLGFWVWLVPPEIGDKYPLPDIAKEIISGYPYLYSQYLRLIELYYKQCVDMLPNVLHRMRYSGSFWPDTLDLWAMTGVNKAADNADATVFPQKAVLYAKYAARASPSDMLGLPRFCSDLANAPKDADVSGFLSSVFTDAGMVHRKGFARILTYSYMLGEDLSNLTTLLEWMPPYLEAYVADNLALVSFPCKIRKRGENQFKDYPIKNEAEWLVRWMDFAQPTCGTKLTSHLNTAVPYSYYGGWTGVSYHSIDFNGTKSIIFNQTWQGFDVTDLSSVVFHGIDCFVADLDTDNSLFSVTFGACQVRHFVFFVSDGTCHVLGHSDATRAEHVFKSGDFALVVEDCPQIDRYTDMINVSIKGLTDRESIQFALSCFLRGASDTVFIIQ